MTHIYKSNMLGKSMSTVVGACLVMAMSFFATNNANAQVTPIWTIDAPTSNWFGTGNTERGLTYNPTTGNLIVASRQAGGIVLVNAATGDSVGVLDATGITGGTFSYNQIRATSDGQIFTANLVTSATSTKIYRWADEASAPKLVYDDTLDAGVRFGDALGAYGSGDDVTILLSGTNSGVIAKFTYDAVNDTLVKEAEWTVPQNVGRGGFSHHIFEDSVLASGTGAGPRLLSLTDGGLGDPFASDIAEADLNSVMLNDFAYIDGEYWVAAGPAFTNGLFYLTEPGDSLLLVESVGPLGSNSNTNNTGGVIFDEENRRLYLMDTNNQLAAYNVDDLLPEPEPAGNLFFSEYIEGSSNNKALEIYNAGDSEVNLGLYRIQQSSNGGGWQFYHEFPMDTYLDAGDTYVIITNQVDPLLFDANDADEVLGFPSTVHHNGNDARAIIYVARGDTTTLDVFGDPDSATDWDVAGVTEGAKEHTLLRKTDITMGNTTPLGSFGTNADNSEWIVKDQNDFSDLGNFGVQPVNVTFRVNMATAPDTVNGDSYSVFINGAIKGEGAGQAFVGGETITWDASATATLENVGGDYWEGTYQMFAGDTLLWKYRYQNDVTNISDDENGFSTVGNPAGWDTRGVVITEDTILDVAYYNDRGDAPAQDFVPFESLQPDTIAVWFRVNVGLLVQEGKFDAATDTIEVRGGQLPLTWDSGTGVKLSAEAAGTGDNVFFSGVGYFNQDSLDTYMPDGNPARTLKYKFYATGPNAQVDWESTPDRFVTITSMEDTTLHYKFFNDAPPTQEKIVDTKLNFGVNVGILEGLGYFNSGLGDSVKVRGFFNSWGQQAMAFNAFAKIWEAKGIDFSSAVGAEGTYKYYIDWDDSRFDDSSPNYIAAIDDPNDTNRDVGYEEPGITGGGNRVFTLVDAPEQEQQEHFFNSMEPEARMDETNVDGGAISVTFSVDMNPAEQRSSSPFNPATDSVYIVFETPFFAISQGFVKGGGMFSSANTAADIEDRRLTDSDGDGVYEVTIDLQLPTLNHFGFYIAYGRPFAADGTIIDNSEGFDAGRRYYQYVQPQVDANLNVTWPSTATFPTLVWKDDNLPFELPPDYGTVSNEEELGTVETFSLEQNYPNPFNPTTNIRFNLPNAADVTLTVYNVLGQKVANLLNNKKFTVGSHDVAFDARNLASGVYIYRIEAGSFTKSKKMMLIK